MAKLQDLITSSEILEVIKGGMLKSELIKRYRTSDQELAAMLVPLYRGGELTKEEFNNFFKGIPLTQPETPAPAALEASPAQEPVNEPVDKPIEIIRSLQKFIGRKVSVDSAQPEESAIEDAHQEEVTQEVEPVIVEEPVVELVPVDDIQTEPASVPEALQTIINKLDSIDNRLSEIEKKLGLD